MQPLKNAYETCHPITDKGGEIRVLVSPRTVGSTQLILGVATLGVGDRVKKHAHDYGEETFFVMQGQGRIHIEGHDSVEFSVGDAVLVPRGRVHSIENTGDVEMRVVFASAPLAPSPAIGHRNIEI